MKSLKRPPPWFPYRPTRHNEGKSLATKRGVPWELKFNLAFDSRSEAIKSEKWIKSMKSRDIVEGVITGKIDLKDALSSYNDGNQNEFGKIFEEGNFQKRNPLH
jgi:predicted GIY-YIG superfamily endonuclease